MMLDTFKYMAAGFFCLNSWLAFGLARRLLSDPHTHTASKLHAGSIGIFLGVALFDMLPHAAHALQTRFPQSALPITCCICVIGFTLPTLIHSLPGSTPASHTHSPLRQAQLRFLLLAFHAVIAGAALGSSDTWKETGLLFFAILSHKALASFAFATPLYINRIAAMPRLQLLTLFSLATPSGILLTLLYAHTVPLHTHPHAIYALLNALAAGTFIHLAIDPMHQRTHTHSTTASCGPGCGSLSKQTCLPLLSGILLIGLLSSSHTFLAQFF